MNKISICITTFNRADLLKQVIDNLAENAGCDYELIIGDDVSNDPKVKEVLNYSIEKYKAFIFYYTEKISHSKNVNFLFTLAHGDYLIHLEDDIIVSHKGWVKNLVEIVENNKSIGLLGPNYPNHHLRLHHEDYDETDYIMGGIQLITREVFEKIGYWNINLNRQQEPDFALRVRMSGYKVGMIRDFAWTHLSPDVKGADQKISDKSVFEFLKYWNKYFLGYFSYKSPLMLTWDNFPPNIMLRKQIFAQENINQNLEKVVIQNHNCNILKVPIAENSYNENDVVEVSKLNYGKIKDAIYEKIDQDLLLGKRKWNIEDFKKEQEIE